MPVTVVTTFWGRVPVARAMMEHTAALVSEFNAHVVQTANPMHVRAVIDNDPRSMFRNLIAVLSPEDPHFRALLAAAKEHGWDVVLHENQPLGAKWNAGVAKARENGNPVMILGSDDFVSPEWVETAETLVEQADIVGLDRYLMHRLINGQTVAVEAYPKGNPRHGESIGSGRTLSTRLLDALAWKPWPAGLRRSLDGGMMAKAGDFMPQARALTMGTPDQLVDVRVEGEGISHWWQFASGAEVVDLPDWWREIDRPPPYRKGSANVSAGIIARVANDDQLNALVCAIDTANDVADEVVVLVDDRSMPFELSVSYRVERHTWTGFSDARNKVAEMCSHDWIFVIDADELLVHPADLREAIENCPDDKVGVQVTGYSVEDQGVSETFASVRAYRKSRCHWRFHPHNELFITETGKRPDYADVVESKAVIESLYVGTTKAKAERAIPDMLKQMEADPGEPRWPYFLARSYAALGRLEDARDMALRCVELAPTSARYARAYFDAAHYSMLLGDRKGMADAVGRGLSVHPMHPDLNYLSVMMTLESWRDACMSRVFSAHPSSSIKMVGAVPQIARMLGFSIGGVK